MRRSLLSGWLVPVAVVLTAGAVGCAREPTSGGAAATPAPVSAASSANEEAAAWRAAVDAYRGMWRAYQQAVTLPGTPVAELDRYAVGDALSTLTRGVQAVRDRGLKGTGEIAVSPKVTAVFPQSAPVEIEITDCLDSSRSHLVPASAGGTYSDPPGGHRRVVAMVRRQPDGSWKVSSFAALGVGTC